MKLTDSKDGIAIDGAKGFLIEKPNVTCEDDADIGSALGHDDRRPATTIVCG
ncbi:MAG: hypothetical protein KTR19_06670 [Hyphomicrobiales bacterium]|nr:hypothetical protein [Hyphomicrobiales bacterium]